MDIYLIRHTELNIPNGICYGQSEIPLKSSFPNEVNSIERKLKDISFNICFASDLERCMSLAFALGYFPISDKRLRELDFGDWELKPWKDIQGCEIHKWFNNYLDTKCPNGESFRELITRVDDFIRNCLDKNYSKVLIFTHGGVIRAMLHLLRHVPIEKVFDLEIGFSELVIIRECYLL